MSHYVAKMFPLYLAQHISTSSAGTKFFQDRNLARLRQTDQTYHAFAQHKQNLSELGTIGSCVICSLTQEHGRRHIVTFLHVQLLSRCNTNSSDMDKTVKLT